MHKTLIHFSIVLLLLGLLAGCRTPALTSTPASDPGQHQASIPQDSALRITGKVATEISWTEKEVQAMETVEAKSTNKQGETETYTGVLLAHLLEAANPQADATRLVFVADDGSTADIALADVQACQDCIVSFRSKGGFSTVLPGFPADAQVKGVVEIQVK